MGWEDGGQWEWSQRDVILQTWRCVVATQALTRVDESTTIRQWPSWHLSFRHRRRGPFWFDWGGFI